MQFSDWTAQLRRRHVSVVAPSAAVPIELYALLPGDRVLHLRCRGTTVTLCLFPGADVRVAVPVVEPVRPELAMQGECRLPLTVARELLERRDSRARLVVEPDAAPLAVAAVDGAARYGWSGHEAGLLRPAQVAPLFDELLAAADLGASPDLPSAA